MNNITLIGRLTADPALGHTQSGKAFCKFSIAVQREFNRDEADFINCVAWDKRAETIAEYLRKGRRIALQGRLSVRRYEQNGETKWMTEVIVDKFEFVDSLNNENRGNEKSEYDKKNDDFDKSIENSGIDDPLLDEFPF